MTSQTKKIEWLHFHGIGEGAPLLLSRGFAFVPGDGVADRYVSPDGKTTAWVAARWNGDDVYYSRAA